MFINNCTSILSIDDDIRLLSLRVFILFNWEWVWSGVMDKDECSLFSVKVVFILDRNDVHNQELN
jgi:hypothetical protein